MDPSQHGGRRVAFFGGSFDPPHLGHLAVARAARAALKLDAVLFAPVGAQPLKPGGPSASFADRLEMTRLAIAGEPGFRISLADAPNSDGAPNYTLETLLRLRAELPAKATLLCLMGADSYFGLRSWHRAAEIPFAAPLIVASRPGQRPDQWIAGLQAALPEGLTMEAAPSEHERGGTIEVRRYLLLNRAGARAPFYLLPGLNVEISASEIREQMQAAPGSRTAGQELLPEAVSAYIRSRGLYA
jgi:nicotinate-nucleotide adenylyltransferase